MLRQTIKVRRNIESGNDDTIQLFLSSNGSLTSLSFLALLRFALVSIFFFIQTIGFVEKLHVDDMQYPKR